MYSKNDFFPTPQRLQQHWQLTNRLLDPDTSICCLDLRCFPQPLTSDSTIAPFQDLPPQLITRYLSPKEQALFTRFTYQKRRKEWLGGRIAVKYALHQILLQQQHPLPPFLTFAPACEILPNDQGAPQLCLALSHPLRKNWHASISHSGDYATAFLTGNQQPCGIDLQMITARVNRVTHHFATAEESALLARALPHLNATTRHTLLWAGKEAVKKGLRANQPTFFQGITLQHLQTTPSIQQIFSHQAHRHPVAIETQLFTGYILAFTRPYQSIKE